LLVGYTPEDIILIKPFEYAAQLIFAAAHSIQIDLALSDFPAGFGAVFPAYDFGELPLPRGREPERPAQILQNDGLKLALLDKCTSL